MYFMAPYRAHLAAKRDFSPQFTPSAISKMQLFFLAHNAKASAIGSPENIKAMLSKYGITHDLCTTASI